eukprot:CAMPEP_0179297336 /NCGR_PEP_ID=MMETSP0797-20121207/45411_1 /TAXON_ID=47934 /ORGANISM="Dinophysis acuminata, Strain DAEP01" /LENGTH=36 /DNA_ID= /DNA_START= /DNA_END= /DNA_ORIENTATION=
MAKNTVQPDTKFQRVGHGPIQGASRGCPAVPREKSR